MTGKLITCLEDCISFASSAKRERAFLLVYLPPPSGGKMQLTMTGDVIEKCMSKDEGITSLKKSLEFTFLEKKIHNPPLPSQ